MQYSNYVHYNNNIKENPHVNCSIERSSSQTRTDLIIEIELKLELVLKESQYC